MAGASGDAAAPSAGAPSPSPTADAVPVVATAGATPPVPLSPAAATPTDAANGGDRDAAAAAAAGSPRSADRAHARLASGKRVEAEFATTHPLSPELSASLPSRIMHMWVVRLVLGGWRSPLTDADLWELAPPEQSRFTSATFAAAWRSRAHEKKGRLPKTVWTIHRSFLLFTAVLKAGDVALGQVSPVFLNQLLEFLERPNEPAASGYGWAIALLVAPLVKTVFENAYFLKTMRMGIRVRSAIQATLYRKSLALSPSSRAGKTVGEIVNYMQLDAQRISDFCQFIHVTWAAPIQVIVTVALLYVYIGPSAFVGLAMAVVTIPLQSYLVKKQAALRKRGVGITDQRVKLINEVLQGIKAVKFYAWEKPFASAIDEVRERELANYRAAIVVRSCFLVIIMTVPTVIAVVTFAFYVGVFKEELTPSRVFTGIALLNQLRQPIMMLPFVVSALVDARVGAKRVEAFLDLDETDGYHRQGAEKAPNQSLARNTGDVDSAEVRSSLHSQLRKAVSAAEAARRGRRPVSDAMDLIGELPSPIPKSLVDADGATGRGSITVVDGEFAWDAVLAAPAEAATTSSSPLSRFKCLPRRRQRAAAAATGGSPADVAVPIDGASPAAAGRPVPVLTDARAGDAVDGAAVAAAVSTTTVTGEGGVVSAPVLRDVNLVCQPGKVTAVIGRVGAGKSSLVHALLGEMRKRRGTVALEGTCAYVAQNAWIFNGTLRDNILFGRAYDAELYQRAIHCSVLETDLSILPFGDATAIGEKGINLSGGQKQRVSLARAIYADADVYLLDDPLSALDAHVGADVFERCLSPATGVLRNRTVVLVTNQLHFLPECHSVIMLADGRVKNSGEFRTLLHEDTDFRLLMEENTGARDEQTLSASHSRSVSRSRKRSQAATSSGGLVVSGPGPASRSAHSMSIEAAPAAVRAAATAAVAAKAAEAAPPTGGAGTPEGTTSSSSGSVSGSGATSGAVEKAPKEDKLITLEERKVGNVRFAAYFEYARACGGLFIFMLILGLFALATATNVLNNWWLSYWSRQSQPGSTVSHSLGFYLGIYCGLAVLYAALTFFRSVWYLFSALQASRRLQKGAIRSVMHAPLSFFDTTPIGRILSRFSRDTDGVDVQLPQFFQQMLTTVFQLIASYVYIAIILPWFIAVAIPIGFGYYALQRFFNRTSLELKRLDSISRSPIYAHFSETLGGLSTIRAYAREADFTMDNLNMVDTNVRAYFCYIAANRWFSLYLEIMGSMLVFATAILAVAGRGNVWAGDVGVALVYALQVTGILGFTVRSITELAGQMNSVERLAFYASELPQEAPHEAGTEGKVAAPEGWPARGAVEINNLKLRYREGLDLVLKGLTIDIKAGERVGVVGRTGAGKSSLMIALLRLVEAAEGTITVDGVDLASLGLSTVRRGVTIIPQDPVMFSGTLRFNIDPFEEFTEAELWAALEAAHLKAFVENFEGGLNSRVAEYGDNLSAGQRQLVCLARALLRKPQLLLLDEASSSLDVTTDALLQTTIRTALRGCTIITIAHRLSTIADYDRVLVLSDGLVADFDAPSVLLSARPPSLLRQLVDALGPAGAAAFERLVALADDNRRAGGGDADNVRRFVEMAGAAAVQEGAAAAEDDEDSGAEGGAGAPPPPLGAPTPVA